MSRVGSQRQRKKEYIYIYIYTNGEVSMVEILTASPDLYYSRFRTWKILGLLCLLYRLYIRPLRE